MEHIRVPMDEFKNKLAKGIFGVTIVEAHEKGICLHCLDPALPKCYSKAGEQEYLISGLCEPCFDKICGMGGGS